MLGRLPLLAERDSAKHNGRGSHWTKLFKKPVEEDRTSQSLMAAGVYNLKFWN